MKSKITEVGEYIEKFNVLTEQDLPLLKIVQSSGLEIHVKKRHPDCIKYLTEIPNIIKEPDYIGHNPKEPHSIELVKVYSDNVQVAIKLDISKGYYYIASVYEIKPQRLKKGIFSGRLKPYY